MDNNATMEGAQAFVKECFARNLSVGDTSILLDRHLAESRDRVPPDDD